MSPADADDVNACSVPTTRSSTTSGLTTTCRSPQPARPTAEAPNRTAAASFFIFII